MKRLIIINILLVLALNILPKEMNVEAKEEENAPYIEQDAEVQVTSRSLEEPRQEMTVESDKKQSKPTEISQEGIDLIKQFEGLRLQAYRLEGEKYWTIGYGTHNSSIYEGQVITGQEAEELLMEELNKVTKQVLEYCEYLDLTQNELSALVSFTYNTGFGNLQKLTANRTRTKEEIAEHITAYTNSKSEVNRNGLQKRREAEKEMFEKGI